MRSLHSLALVTAIAAAGTACGGDNGNGNGNGPDNDPPVAAFTAPACTQGTACTFTDASTDDVGIQSRAWTFENGTPATSTQATQQVTFNASGPQTVTLTVTDAEGESDNVSQDVNVAPPTGGNQPPTAAFAVSCSSLECTFDNNSADADGTFTSAWNFGDGQFSSEANPVHDYVADGDFSVTLVVTDDDGATASITQVVSVAPAATLSCNGTPNCSLTIDVPSTVVVTLVDEDCEIAGNTFRITEPFEETLFDDGCNETEGQSFPLQGGAVIGAGTEIRAEVISGGGTLVTEPAVRVTGTFATGWTLSFDDGVFADPGGPDFNDLIITIVATPE